MATVFARSLEAVRVWLGFDGPADNRVHGSHGWLLPSVSYMRALAFDRVLAMAPVPVAPAVRGRRR